MKKFRWILLSGLLVAATSVAQAQTSQGASPIGAPGAVGAPGAGGASETGFSNAPVAATTTTTTTTGTGIAPDSQFLPADDAAMSSDSSSMPNTGGEPMIAVLAGLSIAGAAVAMRRKVTA